MCTSTDQEKHVRHDGGAHRDKLTVEQTYICNNLDTLVYKLDNSCTQAAWAVCVLQCLQRWHIKIN